MAARSMSPEGRERLTKPWEDFVPYPYDDKVPPKVVDGKRVYEEYTGGALKGTATIGWGHTDAAGLPKVVPGMRITEAEGEQILANDLAPCDAMVNRALTVDVTQHQHDALADLAFNCPSAIPHVTSLVNAGNWPQAEHVMTLYVNSKGERMAGLVRRRAAEIAWANTPDDPETAAATVAVAPKAEVSAPPGTMATSKTGAASVTVGAGGVTAAAKAAHDAAAPFKDVKQDLTDLGILDLLVLAAHQPLFWVGIGIAVLAAFIWLDRRGKLVNFHV